MGLAEPTTTAALLRRLALPAVFVAIVAYTQLSRSPGEPVGGAPGERAASPEVVTTELTGPTMGTTFTVKVRGPELSAGDGAALSEAVTGALEGVNAAMSTWLKTSELSRFNDGPANTPFAFSPQTLEVLEIARTVYQDSGGAFDVTVGPLVNRWGFGPDDRIGPPDAAEIAALLAVVGQDRLIVDLKAGTVTKPDSGLRIDLSAVAKGYGVDRVALAVEALGHSTYMVEVGGEVRARASGGTPWIIGVESPELNQTPDRQHPTVTRRVALEQAAMATSGDYRNYILDGDRLRSHTIDPRTGAPVEHTLASVTVIHPSCAVADAWATALMVLGPEQGLATARQLGLVALFITRSGSGEDLTLAQSSTDSFAAFVVDPPGESPR